MPQTVTKTLPANNGPRPTKPKVNRGWTPERRTRQSARIKIWAPWAYSTGPRTTAGKKRSAQNAAKPWRKNSPDRRFALALRDHSRYLSDLNNYIALLKIGPQNELLRRLRYNARRRLLRQGKKVTIGLFTALLYHKFYRHCERAELDRNNPADCLKRPL